MDDSDKILTDKELIKQLQYELQIKERRISDLEKNAVEYKKKVQELEQLLAAEENNNDSDSNRNSKKVKIKKEKYDIELDERYIKILATVKTQKGTIEFLQREIVTLNSTNTSDQLKLANDRNLALKSRVENLEIKLKNEQLKKSGTMNMKKFTEDMMRANETQT